MGPQRIFHYTTAQGLIGIISSGSLWLSDYRSLNDRSEMEYSFEIIKEAIQGIRNVETVTLLSGIGWDDVLGHDRVDPVAIGSFSASADNPVLWRLYSRGQGYVIGIDAAALEAAVQKLPNARLDSVIYSKGAQLSFVREKLTEFVRSKSFGRTQSHDETPQEFMRRANEINFLFWLYRVAPFIKSTAFEHELEWRISMHVRDNRSLMFRTRNNDIVPYIQMKLALSDNPETSQSASWLKSIDIGSQVDRKRIIPQIYALLEASRINPKKVEFFQNKFPI